MRMFLGEVLGRGGRFACLAIVFLVAGGASMRGQAGSVTLSAAAAKAVFATGETIAISLTLRNNGNNQILISAVPMGTITVTAFQRNGKNVPGRRTEINLDDELGATLIASLKPLTKNQSVTTDWSSVTDPKLTGQALRMVQYIPGGPPIATLYPANVPGIYRVSIVYRFPAVPGTPSSVFSGNTNVAHIQFQIK